MRRSIQHIGLLLGAGISARAAAFESAQDSTNAHSAATRAHHHEMVSADEESGNEDPLGLGMSREGSGTAWQPDSQSVFNAMVLELGYVRDFELGPTTIGLGAVGSANFLSSGLQPFYGSKVPLGGMIFLRLRPAPMAHMSHSG